MAKIRALGITTIGDNSDIREAKARDAKIRADRAEASRLASLANKRVARLEKNGLQDSPAYQIYVEGGRFGVKGKTHREVQSELRRLRRFVDSKTSTITGAKQVLTEMAANTGFEYEDFQELKQIAPKFFELASKVEQYLRQVDDIASAIGYQKIWEAINQYTKEANVNLSQDGVDVDNLILKVTDALKQFEKPLPVEYSWYIP